MNRRTSRSSLTQVRMGEDLISGFHVSENPEPRRVEAALLMCPIRGVVFSDALYTVMLSRSDLLKYHHPPTMLSESCSVWLFCRPPPLSLSSSLCFMSVQVYKADSKTCWHRCSLSIRSPKIHRGLKTERDPANGEGEGGTIFKHTESDVGYLHSAVHPHCLSFCLTGRHKVMLAQSLWAAFKVWKMSRFEVWRGSRTTETGSARESLAIL